MKNDAEQAATDPTKSGAQGPVPRSDTERTRVIAEILERLRPALQADGGDLTLVAVEGDKVRVRLGGACISCGAANETLGGIRRQLVRELGEPVLVVPAL